MPSLALEKQADLQGVLVHFRIWILEGPSSPREVGRVGRTGGWPSIRAYLIQKEPI